jgi:O-antigen ligase
MILQASDNNLFFYYRNAGAMLCLCIYLVLSFTNLPPLLVLSTLAISGLSLLIEGNVPAHTGLRGRDSTAFIFIVLFFISYMASVTFSYDILESVNSMAVLFPGLLMAYILNQLPPHLLRYFAWGLSLMVLTSSCITILMFLQASNMYPGLVFQERGTPALVVPNDLLASVIFFPVVVATLITETNPVMKILAIVTLAILATAMYLTDSRACFLTAIVMILLHLFCFRRNQLMLNGLLVLLVICLADLIFQLGLLKNFSLLREENARFGIWLAGLASWSDHPILGYGPSHFELAYELGISSLELPDWAMVETRQIPWAHNLYIEALVERGVLGLGTLIFLLSLIFSRIRRHWLSSTEELRSFYYAVFICFVGFIFAGLLESTMQRIWVANSLFIFLGLAVAEVRTEKE